MSDIDKRAHLEEILDQTATLRRKVFEGGKSGWSSASDAAKLSENFARLAAIEINILDRLPNPDGSPQPKKPAKSAAKLR
jgi:hypothetical protein